MPSDYSIIQNLRSSKELEEHVAALIIEACLEPGLILLPVGKTFEDRIYPMVNEYFKYEEIKLFADKEGEQVYKDKHHKISSDLRISHLDELVNAKKNSFSTRLVEHIPDLVNQLKDNFCAIDIDDVEKFEKFIRKGGGPRMIFMGLGSDPSTAHVAFMGEEYINMSTAIVELADAAKEEHACSQALTIGADVFQTATLESIVVVVSGQSKAESLKAAFEDQDTGLGYLIVKHSDKLKILVDDAALTILQN